MSGTTAPPAGAADAAAHRARDVRRGRRWAAFGLIGGVVVAADQVPKAWVDGTFPLASVHGPGAGLAAPTPVLGDLVRIAKSYNDGGIFGLFGASAPVLALGSVVVIGLILAYQARQGTTGHPLLTVALGLLLGGAIGNLLDRLRHGHVVDFVDMGLGGFRWYTFNVADAAISISIVVLIVLGLFAERGGPDARRTEAAAPVGVAEGGKPAAGR
jgi:signal peptidase II